MKLKDEIQNEVIKQMKPESNFVFNLTDVSKVNGSIQYTATISGSLDKMTSDAIEQRILAYKTALETPPPDTTAEVAALESDLALIA